MDTNIQFDKITEDGRLYLSNVLAKTAARQCARKIRTLQPSIKPQMIQHIMSNIANDQEFNHLLDEASIGYRPPIIESEDELLSLIIWDMHTLPSRCVDIKKTSSQYFVKHHEQMFAKLNDTPQINTKNTKYDNNVETSQKPYSQPLSPFALYTDIVSLLI
jgi:hypothetical protein